MMRAPIAICVLAPCVLLPLSACQKVPLAQAEQACVGEAQQSQYAYPTGSLGIGVGSGGYSGVGLGLQFSPSFFMGGTPNDVYATCVRNRSGQFPSQPYSSLPEQRM